MEAGGWRCRERGTLAKTETESESALPDHGTRIPLPMPDQRVPAESPRVEMGNSQTRSQKDSR